MAPLESGMDTLGDAQSLDSSPMGSASSTSPSTNSEYEVTQDMATSLPASAKERFIYLPDLFSSIMAVKPVVNPNYHEVKPQAESWITEVIQGNSNWAARNSKADFTYLAALWAPSCDEEALRLVVDWNHWVFLFDDQFDEGHLSSDPVAAQEEIDKTVEVMEDVRPPVLVGENAIRYVFQTLWDRLKKRSSPVLQQRWKDMHRRFFNGVLQQVQVKYDQRAFTQDVQEYMGMRRRTVGVDPVIVIAQSAEGVDLPQYIFDHPSLQECMCVSTDLVILSNDMLSYRRDLEFGVDHNLVIVLMGQGLSIQQAVDKMGSMLDDCYRRWYSILANMPVWGKEIDRQVLKFVDICRNAALGNLYWSFKSGRYLGTDGHRVYETRILNLPPCT